MKKWWKFVVLLTIVGMLAVLSVLRFRNPKMFVVVTEVSKVGARVTDDKNADYWLATSELSNQSVQVGDKLAIKYNGYIQVTSPASFQKIFSVKKLKSSIYDGLSNQEKAKIVEQVPSIEKVELTDDLLALYDMPEKYLGKTLLQYNFKTKEVFWGDMIKLVDKGEIVGQNQLFKKVAVPVTVIEASGDDLLVTDDYGKGDYRLSISKFLNQSIQAGDRLIVTYNGVSQQTYPAVFQVIFSVEKLQSSIYDDLSSQEKDEVVNQQPSIEKIELTDENIDQYDISDQYLGKILLRCTFETDRPVLGDIIKLVDKGKVVGHGFSL
jgi:hypothetical protein